MTRAYHEFNSSNVIHAISPAILCSLWLCHGNLSVLNLHVNSYNIWRCCLFSKHQLKITIRRPTLIGYPMFRSRFSKWADIMFGCWLIRTFSPDSTDMNNMFGAMLTSHRELFHLMCLFVLLHGRMYRYSKIVGTSYLKKFRLLPASVALCSENRVVHNKNWDYWLNEYLKLQNEVYSKSCKLFLYGFRNSNRMVMKQAKHAQMLIHHKT